MDATRMSKTEAAEMIATNVHVWSRRTGQPVTRDLIEERMSELGGDNRDGLVIQHAARTANWRTVLRIVRNWERLER